MSEDTNAAGAADRAEDRRMLAQSVEDFTRRATDMARVRKWRETAPGFDRGLWREMAELGWTGVLVPEARGGAGLGIGEMAVVAQGLARALVPEPIDSCAGLAARTLGLCENDAAAGPLLEGIAGGDLIAAVAFQEQAGDLGTGTVATRARAGGGKLVLSGRKRFVAGAAGADGYVVSADAGGGTLLAWVPAGTAGLTVGLETLADGRFIGTLELADAAVPEANLLAPPEVARSALDRAVDETTVIVAAELYGIMDQVLDTTLDYLRTRVQFGRAIGSFQSLQHRAVDLYVQKNLASVALEDAVRAVETGAGTARAAASVSRAKARCNDAAQLITRQAIQMHGAIGFTEDSDVGLYVKRAITLAAWLGNSPWHRRRYVRLAEDETE